ncbi:hypothetical protein FUAX_34990 [Fulvitalea axinellae]|uniref:Uncharacterized protein n=1 Tax=Fulvitalea axinellae TaxID=1182444 RepID=A0AAU9CSS4_9BACT|nr:hypothetical protein FUAX_34990 [Fulvitalea axinellae]
MFTRRERDRDRRNTAGPNGRAMHPPGGAEGTGMELTWPEAFMSLFRRRRRASSVNSLSIEMGDMSIPEAPSNSLSDSQSTYSPTSGRRASSIFTLPPDRRFSETPFSPASLPPNIHEVYENYENPRSLYFHKTHNPNIATSLPDFFGNSDDAIRNKLMDTDFFGDISLHTQRETESPGVWSIANPQGINAPTPAPFYRPSFRFPPNIGSQSLAGSRNIAGSQPHMVVSPPPDYEQFMPFESRIQEMDFPAYESPALDDPLFEQYTEYFRTNGAEGLNRPATLNPELDATTRASINNEYLREIFLSLSRMSNKCVQDALAQGDLDTPEDVTHKAFTLLKTKSKHLGGDYFSDGIYRGLVLTAYHTVLRSQAEGGAGPAPVTGGT